MNIKLKNWLSLVGFILFILAILFGGPAMTRWLNNKYKQRIDRNGEFLKAVVTRRKTFKGRLVYFSYSFNGTNYENREQNDCLFDLLNKGDTILIKVDITEPENSYVVMPDCNDHEE
ncbi:hypothetical protein LZZ85_20105 [Terrimonas sp. NA20]|uniref:DUF3592 domain-containing protein n=1 Tax=Terrimonas ginsenosidimutans TaxID=2908004 RepID=A0ABS9KWK1_9BACT|nr:hypothetical protein [Terrimonas ginsenosidimutans]MCG2616614.1 hypothetical protein [Terrimonas ginsenosidimutans]